MNESEFLKQVWSYYSLLENEFLASLRFVDFDEQNYSTFSVEYEKQLLSIGSEIDVISKQLHYGSKIGEYKAKYVENGFQNISLVITLNQVLIKPFEDISNARIWWWDAYNDVKHNRLTNNNYTRANQKTVLYSLGALYILVRKLFVDLGMHIAFLPKSRLFTVDGEAVYNVLDAKNGWVQMFTGDNASTIRLKNAR